MNVHYDFTKYQRQSKLESLCEATLNIASGFVVSFLVWVLIAAPLFGIPVKFAESFWLTCLFTFSSLARSYLWRRFFERRINRRIHKWASS